MSRLRFLWDLAAVVGSLFAALWLLGAVGIGDFRVYFGPVGSIQCVVNEVPR